MLHHKPIIGIAGGIGAGKSAVAKALAEMGCVVSHSDREARAALRDPVIRDTLVAWWSADILDAEGAVDRAVVARIVFEDSDQRRRLEALTHPWIEARRRELFEDAPAESPALVIDAPLLFETGLDHQCDAVIFVDAPRELRLRRVATSRGWDDAELARREESQLPLDEKRSRADYVLRNDGELSDLVDQVHPVLSRIVESCRT